MLKKTCPWCDEKATINQLGRRPIQKSPKWYQFSRSVQVCPYCAGAIKLGGKAFWFLVLALPSFLSFLMEIFVGFDLLDNLGATGIGWVLFLIGCVGTYFFSIFIKVENE